MTLDCQSKQTAKVATATSEAVSTERGQEQEIKLNLSSSQCSSHISQANKTQISTRNMENISGRDSLQDSSSTPSTSSSISAEYLNQNSLFSKSHIIPRHNEEKSSNTLDIDRNNPNPALSSSILEGAPFYYSGSLNIHPSTSSTHPSLKLKIPINSNYNSSSLNNNNNNSHNNNNNNPNNSPSASSILESSPPSSTTYSELTPLPSPLVPTDSTSAIFKAYNGQSPPTATISRAPSLRSSGLRFNLHSTININSSKNSQSPVVLPKKSLEDDCSISSLPLTSDKYANLPLADSNFLSGSSLNNKPNTVFQSRQIDLQPAIMPLEGLKSTNQISKISTNAGFRSISEYVPQPLTPSSLASYHRPSSKKLSSKNTEEESGTDLKTKNDNTLKDKTNENIHSSCFPKTTAQDNELKHHKIRNASNVITSTQVHDVREETSSLETKEKTTASEVLAEDKSEKDALNLETRKNSSSHITTQAPRKVQLRSVSSGSTAFGQTIQREKPVVTSKPEPSHDAALTPLLSTSTMQTSSSSSSSSITTIKSINISNPQTKACSQSSNPSFSQDKPPQITGLLDATNSTPMGDQSSKISQHHSKGNQEGKKHDEKQIISSQVKPNTPLLEKEKNTSSQSNLESSSSTAATSTSTGSSNSSISNASASSSLTPLSSDAPDKFYSTRVYEAYDTNMKKSTWNEIKQLGQGAFSRVILAYPADRYLKPEYQGHSGEYKVAIKVVDIQIEGGHVHSRERMESGLKREIEILKTMKHPSLIRMYAFNIDTQSAMMVLPLCPGGDLFELVINHRNDMKSQLVRRIFGEICRAVSYLHENFVVHRDIKLENVLLNIPVTQLLESGFDYLKYPKAIATLTDMGLSRKIDPNDPFLSTRCGSVDYVPPELLMGQNYDGRQTDSWALGVLLYAMMEGRLPFDPPVYPGRPVRGKVAHRIARVEWSWIIFRDHHDNVSEHEGKGSEDEQWEGGMELVEGTLQKRDKRLLATDMVNHPWVKGSAPENLEYPWIPDINYIFKG